MAVSSAKALWSAIHSPAFCNVIFIAGIHFAYVSCCLVGQASASFAVVKNNLLLTEYAWNLNTLWKFPIVLSIQLRSTVCDQEEQQ